MYLLIIKLCTCDHISSQMKNKNSVANMVSPVINQTVGVK